MKKFNEFLEAVDYKMVALKFTEDTLYPFVFFQASVGHNPDGYVFNVTSYKLYWDKYLFGEQINKRILKNKSYLIFKFHDLTQEVDAGPALDRYTIARLMNITRSKYPIIRITEIHNIDIIPFELLPKEDLVDGQGGFF